MKKEVKLTENKIREVIKEELSKILKEDIIQEPQDNIDQEEEYDDFETLGAGQVSDILQQCGYEYVNAYDVKSKDGNETGVRYEIVPDQSQQQHCTIDQLLAKLRQAAGGDEYVIASQGYNRYAPEIKRMSIVIIDK